MTHLFACPELPPISTTSPSTPSPPLALFIAYALHRTRLHHSVTFAALYLLLRLKSRFPAARGSSGHRLFISAFMLASKVICDDTYSNKSWSIVGQGMFALREINQMEREMCSYLEWQLNVDPTELKDFEHKVRHDFKGPGPYPTYALPSPAPSPMPSTTPYASGAPAPAPTFVTGQIPSASAAPSKRSSSQPIPIPHPERAYLTPPTSPDTPETPEASRSLSTSPASSASPPTPPGEVDLTVKIATPGGSAPMAVDPPHRASKQPPQPQRSSGSSSSASSSTGAAPQAGHLGMARNPAAKRPKCNELFAMARPVAW